MGGFKVPNLQQSWPIGNVDMGNTLTDPNDVDQTGDISDVGTTQEYSMAAYTTAPSPMVMRWLIRYA